MAEKRLDLRAVRSRKAIQQAFVKLIEEKGFEAITVKDITTKAEINRGTFYTHYTDKHDLMTKCQEEMMEGMYQVARQNLSSVMSRVGNKEEPVMTRPPSATIFEYIDENRIMMKALLGSKGDASFQLKLKDFLWKTLFGDNEYSIFNKEKLLAPEQYLASYIASAHIGVIQQWLENDHPESPREMARILSLITMHGPFTAAGLISEPCDE